jgi:hypothetical protein
MSDRSYVRSFGSSSPEYHRAFKTFLAHTDQKDKALAWLMREVKRLQKRAVMIDAGAGSGRLTSSFEPHFDHVMAIEPNPSLQAELRVSCPKANVSASTIAETTPSSLADFVLCSHVFYHIPKALWDSSIRVLMGWLGPGGVLAIALQNPRTDCMRMVHHFIGGQFDLGTLQRAAESVPGDFSVQRETIPAHIETTDLSTACEIAEFVLNVLPMPSPPLWSALERFVDDHFKQASGKYRYSCDQDFLKITRIS